MAFTDESNKMYVGRFLLPDEILPWLKAQKKPTWAKYIMTHHTWSPTFSQWAGDRTLKAIFNYYRDTRGWDSGKGPHFWIAPKYKNGPIGIWIGTHPYNKGIGAIDWNSDTLHCEYAWNGDVAPFTDSVLKVGAALMGALEEWIGIPLEPVKFLNGWAVKGKKGHLFHRDTPKAGKTCPGKKNTHELVFGRYKLYNTEQDVWAPEALWLKEKGIIQGYPDGTFRPQAKVTRGQLAIALKRFYAVIEKEFKFK